MCRLAVTQETVCVVTNLTPALLMKCNQKYEDLRKPDYHVPLANRPPEDPSSTRGRTIKWFSSSVN